MKVFGRIIAVLLKGCFGLGAIYLTNLALGSLNISAGVGINVVNGALIGILGISGFLLLYILSALDHTLFH